jgi:chaperonin GroES
MNLRPVNDRIIVKRDPTPGEQVKGGIVIPESVQEKPQTATVVAVGNGLFEERLNGVSRLCIYTHIPVKEGQRVILGKYSGAEYGGFLIIGPGDILAIIEE